MKDNIWTLLVTAYAHTNAHGRNAGKADSAKTLYREEGKRQQLLTKSIQ
jgi:hypothetical protein